MRNKIKIIWTLLVMISAWCAYWNTASAKQTSEDARLMREIEAPSATGVAWTSDGKLLAAYTNFGSQIDVWTSNGTKIHTMKRPRAPDLSSSIDFVNDHTLLTPSERLSKTSSLTAWDASSGLLSSEINAPLEQSSLSSSLFSVSADKRVVAVTMAQPWKVIVYSIQSWQAQTVIDDEKLGIIISLAIADDGSVIAVGNAGGEVAIFDARSGQNIHKFQVYDKHLFTSAQTLAFSPDAQEFVTGAGLSSGNQVVNEPVSVWRTSDGNRVAVLAMADINPIRTLSWKRDGNVIAVGARDGSIRLWNPKSGSVITWPLTGTPMAAAFSPDAQLMAVCAGDLIKIYDVSGI